MKIRRNECALSPSFEPQPAKLFESAPPSGSEKPSAAPVDLRFPDIDDGQPGDLPDRAKEQIQRLEGHRGRKGAINMIDHIIVATHKFTRNIPPPSTPGRYDPIEPSRCHRPPLENHPGCKCLSRSVPFFFTKHRAFSTFPAKNVAAAILLVLTGGYGNYIFCKVPPGLSRQGGNLG